MKKLLILSTTLLTFNSFAIEFKDKGNILGELNKFLDSPTYENSFSLGEVSSFDTKTCTYFDDQNLCETSSLELKVGAVDDIEVIIENSDANSEDFIVSKNKWEKYKGNYIQIMLDDSDWLQSIQTKNTNLVDNDEVAYEYEVLGSRFIKIDHLGQDKSAMIVTGILKWRNGLVAAANFRIVKGMSFLASLNSYSIDLIGFAKVSMTLREYDHNENL